MILDNKFAAICFNSSAPRLTVKATKKSNLPWSATFIVIVYRRLRKRWRTRCGLSAFALFNCKTSSVTLRFDIELVSNSGQRLGEVV